MEPALERDYLLDPLVKGIPITHTWRIIDRRMTVYRKKSSQTRCIIDVAEGIVTMKKCGGKCRPQR